MEERTFVEGRVDDGVVPPAAGAGSTSPLGSRPPVRESAAPRKARRVRHHLLDEPQGQLPAGQCADGIFFNSRKKERVHGTRFATRAEAIAVLFDYIKVLYNWSRRHSTLGCTLPTQFLNDWITAQHEQNLAA